VQAHEESQWLSIASPQGGKRSAAKQRTEKNKEKILPTITCAFRRGEKSASYGCCSVSLILDFLYQLAQIGISYVADFGLVVDGHQRNCNISIRLLQIIGDDPCTAALAFTL